MSEAFTLCDAYHCSFMGNTNPNRLFLWTGTNDPLQLGGGPALYNQYDNVGYEPAGGYTWLTYCERLQAAGVSWHIYQNMADNFTDNSVAGFRTFRASHFGEAGADPELARRGLSTRDLHGAKAAGSTPRCLITPRHPLPREALRRDGDEHLGLASRRGGRLHLDLQLQ
jgi:phospholipase C